MNLERRAFLSLLGVGSSALIADSILRDRWSPITRVLAQEAATHPAALAHDDAFWMTIRQAYVTDPGLIDLDNANVAPTPAPVIEAFVRRINELRRAPSITSADMFAEVSSAKVRPRLAQLFGTTPEELGLLRNATDALNTVLRGFPLSRGDEILVTSHEYPDMVEIALQRARREGIVVRTVQVASGSENPHALVDRINRVATKRTKLLLISHVSAWSGEILPVQAACEAARRRNIATLVDAAQSIGILDVSLSHIGCDFMAASLHKWLAAPIGTGVLAMRSEWRDRVEPLTPSAIPWTHPMGRFEWNGTALEAGWASAGEALDFQEKIGLARKRARIGVLGAQWQDKLSDLPKVRLLTPREDGRSFGVASFAVDGVPSDKLARHLREAAGINVQDKAGKHSPFQNAIRVSPGVYTLRTEVDKLVTAVSAVAEEGIPARG